MKAAISVFVNALCLMTVAILLSITCAFSQPPVEERTADLAAVLGKVKLYPSLTPRIFMKVGFNSVFDPTQRNLLLEDPANPGSYVIQKLDSSGNPITGVDSERVEIDPSIDTTRAPGVAYLSLKANTVKAGDKIRVGIKARRRTSTGDFTPVIIFHNQPVPIDEENLHTYTLVLEPGVVPNQELTDGNKRTVGRLNFKLDLPSLIPNNVLRVYFVTDNIISSNGKDKGSKAEFRGGVERSLTNSWYVPAFLEGKFMGNQTFNNRSFVLSGGTKSILPWAWTRAALFNSFVKAPISPEFEFGFQYERRLREQGKSPLDKNNTRFFSQIAWNPIHLLTGKDFSANDISLEVFAKGWYFPEEIKTGMNRVRKLEGRYDISLLLPVQLQVFDFFLRRPESGVNSRVRVKYSSGANEANGFQRSKTLTFAIEAVK